MLTLREFETMINLIKTTGEYKGIAYNHPGPAHLSMGQEASAVGMAFHLDENDYIFGSHRSHGEIMAKGLSAIEKLSDEALLKIMKEFFGGDILKAVDTGKHESVKALAIDFLIYGAMAEIFARTTGFNRGLGGSMHTFFTPFGIYPEQRHRRRLGHHRGGRRALQKGQPQKGHRGGQHRRRVSGLRPGAGGAQLRVDGPVYPALGWRHEVRPAGALQHLQQQLRHGRPDRRRDDGLRRAGAAGRGFSPTQMHAERVDGFNPLAVIEAYGRKKKLLQEGQGPVLLDVLTYRFAGHSPSDSSSYRTKEEIAAWEAVDPINVYRQQLIDAGVATEAECDAIHETVNGSILQNFKLAIDDSVSPRMDAHQDPDCISRLMFSNGRVEAFDTAKPDVLLPLEENPRVKAIAGKERFLHEGRQACLQEQALPAARRHLRGGRRPVLQGPDDGLLRRGRARLGRRVRGVPRADRGAAVSPPVQLPDLRGRDRRHRRRLCDGGRPRAGGTDVLRLPGPRGRRSVQPDVQVAGDVRGRDQDAAGAARVGGLQVRRPAFPGLDGADRPHPGPQGGLPRYAL